MRFHSGIAMVSRAGGRVWRRFDRRTSLPRLGRSLVSLSVLAAYLVGAVGFPSPALVVGRCAAGPHADCGGCCCAASAVAAGTCCCAGKVQMKSCCAKRATAAARTTRAGQAKHNAKKVQGKPSLPVLLGCPCGPRSEGHFVSCADPRLPVAATARMEPPVSRTLWAAFEPRALNALLEPATPPPRTV